MDIDNNYYTKKKNRIIYWVTFLVLLVIIMFLGLFIFFVDLLLGLSVIVSIAISFITITAIEFMFVVNCFSSDIKRKMNDKGADK